MRYGCWIGPAPATDDLAQPPSTLFEPAQLPRSAPSMHASLLAPCLSRRASPPFCTTLRANSGKLAAVQIRRFCSSGLFLFLGEGSFLLGCIVAVPDVKALPATAGRRAGLWPNLTCPALRLAPACLRGRRQPGPGRRLLWPVPRPHRLSVGQLRAVRRRVTTSCWSSPGCSWHRECVARQRH
jgi:hypothetical protein